MVSTASDGQPAIESVSLHQVYATTLKGVGPLKGAEVAARKAMAGDRTSRQAVMALVRSHVAMAGAQGFAAGLGGWVTQLVAMPASAGAVVFLQVRLAASIAHVYGHDLDDAHVRQQILSCVTGAQRVGGAARAGAQSKAARKVAGKVAAGGGKLLAKVAGSGAKGAAGPVAKVAGKGLPYVGGVIGGGIDAVATGIVGEVARRTFAPATTEGSLVADGGPVLSGEEPLEGEVVGGDRVGRGGALVARFRKLTSRRARTVHEDAGTTVLGDVVPDLSVATVEIGWKDLALSRADADVDASAFLCRRNGKVPSDDHFVFFNNSESPDGAVRLDPAALTDADEHAKAAFTIDTAAIPANIQKIVFAVSVYGSDLTFGAMDGGFLSVVDQTQDLEIIRYEQPDRHTGAAAVVIGELTRGRAGWAFHPVDRGYPGGLSAIAERYGVEVD